MPSGDRIEVPRLADQPVDIGRRQGARGEHPDVSVQVKARGDGGDVGVRRADPQPAPQGRSPPTAGATAARDAAAARSRAARTREVQLPSQWVFTAPIRHIRVSPSRRIARLRGVSPR